MAPAPPLRLCALLLAVSWACTCAHAAPKTLSGVVSIVAEDHFGDTPETSFSKPNFFVRPADGIEVALTSGSVNLPAALRVGARVTVTGEFTPRPGGMRGGSMDVFSVREDAAPPADLPPEAGGGAPVLRRALRQAGATTKLAVTEPVLKNLFIPVSFEGCPKQNVSALADPTTATYYGPPSGYSSAQIQALAFWDGTEAKRYTTLGGRWASCSKDQTTMPAATSLVVDMVQMPCPATGQLASQNLYTTWACNSNDYYGWMKQALAIVAARGIDVKAYPYRTLIIPGDAVGCGWAGLGNLACTPTSWSNNFYTGVSDFNYCNTWIDGGYALGNGWVYMHETGHNVGLHHAGTLNLGWGLPWGPYNATFGSKVAAGSTATISSEYGDLSSIMGSGSSLRCFNDPQNWQLGWNTLQLATAATLPAAAWTRFTVTAPTRSASSGLKVDVSAFPRLPGAPTTWRRDAAYVSYRLKEGGDGGLSTTYAGKLNLNMHGAVSNKDYQYPGHATALSTVGSTYKFPGTGLTVRLAALNPTAGTADFDVCRPGTTPLGVGVEDPATSCVQLVDADCNGLVGAADPACAPPSPPPPSPPPSPPPPPPDPCNYDGVCGVGETCTNCPSDCPTLATPAASCGNGVCEGGNGENYTTCPADCAGKTGKNAYCCGFNCATGCSAAGCNTSPKTCTMTAVVSVSYCCGDAVCTAGVETAATCARDCAAPPPPAGGGGDTVITPSPPPPSPPPPPVCKPSTSACSASAECCSGNCKTRTKTCA